MPKASKTYEIHDCALYGLSSKKRLAEILRVDLKKLEAVPRELLYTKKWKHKREERWLNNPPPPAEQENYRQIDIPHPILKDIQARIADLLSRIRVPYYLYSPVRGRSYVDNAYAHRGAVSYWQLDIADYFGSCTEASVAGFFQRKLKTAPGITCKLVSLVTKDGRLPQGSPCSPILAFFSKIDIWEEVHLLSNSANLTLSIYADDVTLSGSIIKKATVWEIKKIIFKHGLRTRPDKEVSTIHKPVSITGVVLAGNEIRLPNKQYKAIAELRNSIKTARSPQSLIRLQSKLRGHYNQRKQVLRDQQS